MLARSCRIPFQVDLKEASGQGKRWTDGRHDKLPKLEADSVADALGKYAAASTVRLGHGW